MDLRLFFTLNMILTCKCQLFDTYVAPLVDQQHAPLSALINTSSISTAIVRSLESPIINLITSTVEKQISLKMDICNSELKLIKDDLEKAQNQTEELKNKLETLENEVKQKPTDCVHIDKSKGSGIYTIFPGNSVRGFQVFCNMETDGGGWTVFQRRINGSTDFYRGWSEYENGFGDLEGEFWLGNCKLHNLTSQGRHELRVDLEDFDNSRRYAKYTTFSVGSKETKYKLTVSGYSGDAGDSFGYANGSPFSTKDRDNDEYSSNCAKSFKGAWWYKSCHHSNLNGLYLKGKHSSYADGINWKHWKGHYYSMKSTTLMTRKVK